MAFFHCETLFLKVITHFISSRQNASVKEDFARHKKKRAEIIGHDTPICVCSIFIVTFSCFFMLLVFFFFHLSTFISFDLDDFFTALVRST